MLGLVEELRSMCTGAPKFSLNTMIHLFGIKFSKTLIHKRVEDLDAIGLMAGLKSRCGMEMRKGVNLGPFVSVRSSPLPWKYAIRTSNLDMDHVKTLAPKLNKEIIDAPEGHLTTTVILFGIKHSDEIKDYTNADLGILCEMAELKRMHLGGIRQGHRLFYYVEFRRYPSEGLSAFATESAAIDAA